MRHKITIEIVIEDKQGALLGSDLKMIGQMIITSRLKGLDASVVAVSKEVME